MNEPMLLIDESHGIYIPAIFIKNFNPETGNWNYDYESYKKDLSSPENEFYWETWQDLLDNAKFTDQDNVTYYLYEAGDIWLVPEGYDNKEFFEFMEG